jgi:hypothetical protein
MTNTIDNHLATVAEVRRVAEVRPTAEVRRVAKVRRCVGVITTRNRDCCVITNWFFSSTGYAGSWNNTAPSDNIRIIADNPPVRASPINAYK